MEINISLSNYDIREAITKYVLEKNPTLKSTNLDSDSIRITRCDSQRGPITYSGKIRVSNN